jgi:hypothetical protein
LPTVLDLRETARSILFQLLLNFFCATSSCHAASIDGLAHPFKRVSSDAYDTTTLASPPRNAVLHGDCIDILGGFAPASVDFVLTDPPYLVRCQSRDGKRVRNDERPRF